MKTTAKNSRLLGGLAPRTFLRRYWQKRPLFVPGALAPAPRLIDERALTALIRTYERRARPYAPLALSSRGWLELTQVTLASATAP